VLYHCPSSDTQVYFAFLPSEISMVWFLLIQCHNVLLGMISIGQYLHHHQLSVHMISRLRTDTESFSASFDRLTFVCCQAIAHTFPAVSGTISLRPSWLLCRSCWRNIVVCPVIRSLAVYMNQILSVHKQVSHNYSYPGCFFDIVFGLHTTVNVLFYLVHICDMI